MHTLWNGNKISISCIANAFFIPYINNAKQLKWLSVSTHYANALQHLKCESATNEFIRIKCKEIEQIIAIRMKILSNFDFNWCICWAAFTESDFVQKADSSTYLKKNKFRNLGIFNSNLCKEIAAKM